MISIPVHGCYKENVLKKNHEIRIKLILFPWIPVRVSLRPGECGISLIETGTRWRSHLAAAVVKLTTKSAGNSLARVGIGEETGGVGLDLLKGEALAGVDLVVVEDTGLEGALEATDGAAALLVTNRVGESNAVESVVSYVGVLGWSGSFQG